MKEGRCSKGGAKLRLGAAIAAKVVRRLVPEGCGSGLLDGPAVAAHRISCMALARRLGACDVVAWREWVS
jgi:hypothetical protein